MLRLACRLSEGCHVDGVPVFRPIATARCLVRSEWLPGVVAIASLLVSSTLLDTPVLIGESSRLRSTALQVDGLLAMFQRSLARGAWRCRLACGLQGPVRRRLASGGTRATPFSHR